MKVECHLCGSTIDDDLPGEVIVASDADGSGISLSLSGVGPLDPEAAASLRYYKLVRCPGGCGTMWLIPTEAPDSD